MKKTATQAEIKKAFKKLAIKYHPDKNTEDPEGAKKKFVPITNAYDTLSDEEKRKTYDQFGAEGVGQKEGGGERGGASRLRTHTSPPSSCTSSRASCH